MHELAVTEGILRVALGAAERAGGHRIQRIDVVLGELSSIVDDSVQFYFDFVSQGTAAESAQLRFRRLPAAATCAACRHSFPVPPPLPAVCPACGGAELQIDGGQECYVESIEVGDEGSGTAADPECQ
jgi:hydrogenase nickel incorporation protein HypA/HybF